MTCAHIYTGGPFVQLNGENTLKPALTDGLLDGNFHYSLFDDEFDLALYTPDDQNLNYVIQPKTPRTINSSDVRITEIRIVCGGGRIARGKITKERASNPVPITYGRLPAHSLNGLMMLSSYTDVNDINTYSSLTRQGDSGSCVYDDQDRPIGMVVAGNNRFTYAIPMSTILNKLSATIIS
ncbi:hypothetical protein J3L18_05795 [Mucilaginibacter gossypii]|uniref:hypothetical protein n=1 Tax=Mucilaginibacter gossypii TaxID=551996 RepID=UPI000DCE0BBB|nr:MULTISPECIES: hypothetical protein [Mucilaginibacter]QTE38586.1 hypothetical protein J3L18_05795 [Mucilaginibacter gossypii]RAV55339.1 hypothetical protein DIU36_19315 [Mucilaginibacter rubeus]